MLSRVCSTVYKQHACSSCWCVMPASSRPPATTQQRWFASGRRPPNGVSALFNQITTKRSPKVAKLLLWLLGRVHEAADPEDMEEQDAVLLGLERLGSLLEQYYHPSNNGK